MKRLLLALAILVPAAPVDAAEISRDWNAVEGPRNAPLTGTWHLDRGREDSVTGEATMWDKSGRRITFAVEGQLRGSAISLRRAESSDGQPCVYFGRLDNDGGIAGTAICNNQQSAWTLAIPAAQ